MHILQHTLFYEYERYTTEEKMNVTKKIILTANDMSSRLASCESQTGENDGNAIFVVLQQEDSYSRRGQYYFTSYCVDDSEAFEKIHGDFRLWNGEGESRIPMLNYFIVGGLDYYRKY